MFGIGLYEIFVLLALLSFILWLIALIDVLKNEFTGNNKLIWFLAVVFVPVIGMVAYFFIGRKQKIVQKK